MMKNKRLFSTFLLILAGSGIMLLSIWQRDTLQCALHKKTPNEKWAEQTILAYIKTKGLDIYFCSDNYNSLLKGILLGDVPELTTAQSAFIKNDVEAQYIMEYAAQNYRLPRSMRSSGTEVPVFEAVPPVQ